MFGDYKVTKSVTISFDNWDKLCSMIDNFVLKQMKIFEEQDKKDQKPKCFIDLMLQSDVYGGNVTKIANDMIVAMIAANETSRNTTINTICHLIKSKESMARTRNEISKSL